MSSLASDINNSEAHWKTTISNWKNSIDQIALDHLFVDRIVFVCSVARSSRSSLLTRLKRNQYTTQLYRFHLISTGHVLYAWQLMHIHKYRNNKRIFCFSSQIGSLAVDAHCHAKRLHCTWSQFFFLHMCTEHRNNSQNKSNKIERKKCTCRSFYSVGVHSHPHSAYASFDFSAETYSNCHRSKVRATDWAI